MTDDNVRALHESAASKPLGGEDDAILAALTGEEWLYGLPIPGTNPELAVKRWGVIEALNRAAERNMAATGRWSADSLVQEAYNMSADTTDPLDRLAETARRLDHITGMIQATKNLSEGKR